MSKNYKYSQLVHRNWRITLTPPSSIYFTLNPYKHVAVDISVFLTFVLHFQNAPVKAHKLAPTESLGSRHILYVLRPTLLLSPHHLSRRSISLAFPLSGLL